MSCGEIRNVHLDCQKGGSTQAGETSWKGAENIDDPRKIERLKTWCADASATTGKSWDYLYVKEEKWNQIKRYF